MNKVRFSVMLLVIMINITVAYIFSHLVVITSASINHKLFWRTGEITYKGDYALFHWRYPPYLREARWLAKKVSCVPNDWLLERKGRFYCNGVLIASIPNELINKYRSKLTGFNRRIPDGKLFVVGETTRSFDSRYFGFIDSKITEKIIPLI